ncbi:heteromeric transposase endonuclease subunit TnsA [Acinetobacter chinensis]|uniref:Heteromeric transposase endonuclease subunit TnsA n=1 Tax=Acinetobacter chinensis TaxID=2004650 RepID=A0A3B7LY39_9GAMM|nr:TnsA endonuclease N-terminal domain-containing protein [Acinetobacter chinensis]AXY55369.1 heteromeric transposase endonuclease subunit TnsA [Acinetobacter chinensis]
MAKPQNSLTEIQIAKRIKEGRGQGSGSTYKPWLRIHEVPSQGLSHRIYSFKTRRTHHLLSNLELGVFLTLDWMGHVQDIREQYPLQRDETIEIASNNGIKHPNIRGINQVMTSDFLVDSTSHKQFVIQVKPLSELKNPRTIEKLEIERRYWASKEIPWYIITEKELNPTVLDNIKWLYSSQTDMHDYDQLLNALSNFEFFCQQHLQMKLSDVCKSIDREYQQDPGQSLADLKQLMAHRLIKFDITQKFKELRVKDIKFYQHQLVEGFLNVANQ